MPTDIDELKQDIKDKELRLSQLRVMDTNKLRAEDRALIGSLEEEITLLKKKLDEE
jgi:hypothetical protein